MNILQRGLFALVLLTFFKSHLLAQYLYKDEVVHRSSFKESIEKLGDELYKKTGISLRLVMLKSLPKEKESFIYEQELLAQFQEPTILLFFSEKESIVDIQVNDTSLYKYFDKKQVLSPFSSAISAFVMALMYADSWEHFNELRQDYGGTILPLLAQKAKPEQVVGKYAAAMFNGYVDIAQQIATTKNITLQNDPGDANQEALFYVKLLFYGFIIYGIVMYIRRKIYILRNKDDQTQ